MIFCLLIFFHIDWFHTFELSCPYSDCGVCPFCRLVSCKETRFIALSFRISRNVQVIIWGRLILATFYAVLCWGLTQYFIQVVAGCCGNILMIFIVQEVTREGRIKIMRWLWVVWWWLVVFVPMAWRCLFFVSVKSIFIGIGLTVPCCFLWWRTFPSFCWYFRHLLHWR